MLTVRRGAHTCPHFVFEELQLAVLTEGAAGSGADGKGRESTLVHTCMALRRCPASPPLPSCHTSPLLCMPRLPACTQIGQRQADELEGAAITSHARAQARREQRRREGRGAGPAASPGAVEEEEAGRGVVHALWGTLAEL